MTKLPVQIDIQEKLARLERNDTEEPKEEKSLVAAAGARPTAWTVQIISLENYNVYNIRQIKIDQPNISPETVGGTNAQAYNLAESFFAAGSLTPGIYTVMWQVGDVNVFYVKP